MIESFSYAITNILLFSLKCFNMQRNVIRSAALDATKTWFAILIQWNGVLLFPLNAIDLRKWTFLLLSEKITHHLYCNRCEIFGLLIYERKPFLKNYSNEKQSLSPIFTLFFLSRVCTNQRWKKKSRI